MEGRPVNDGVVNVVLAHGCFDLLHLGHIRHLTEARKLGDRLVVSITDDAYVRKGHGRPHFTAAQRAEALLALSCVDDVIINPHLGAAQAIERIRPAVYVKGIDYGVNGADTLTEEEHAAVKAVGARVHITTSEKFSSSRLINHERFPPETLKYLLQARTAWSSNHFKLGFALADKLSVCFVGEFIVDEYRYVQGLGRASKELMLATVETGAEKFAGGTVAAAKHAEWANVEWVSSGEPIKKTRFVDRDFNRKLFDVYSNRRVPVSASQRASFRNRLAKAIEEHDVVIAMDFGHGLIGKYERDMLYDAKFLAVNVQTNAGNYGFNLATKYDKADFICIDDPEARLAAGMADEPIEVVARVLSDEIDCGTFLITHGKFGSYYLNTHMGISGYAPAFSTGGIDTLGAGDAVMAVTAPLVASGMTLDAVAFVGNIAGSIKTQIIGHQRHVTRAEILQTVEALLA